MKDRHGPVARTRAQAHCSARAAATVLAVAVGWLALAAGPVAGQEPEAAPGQDEGAQVLTRGPVHEAFAAPVVQDPKPGLTVPKEPPQPVEEMPPDQKPAGQNVQWISGYWSWDQARNDFVWLSGVWREPPPGRQWVPGYWHQVEGGFQWVAGAWVPVGQNGSGGPGQAASASASQASYLPAPPASLETGPNSPAPSGGVFWSPGSWYWQENRYVWRPGFWAAAQPTWVWVPSHFVWTPGGYLFVEGFWDLPLASRGLMFAPVYYPQPVYLQPAYVFTPSITIATPGLVANLFVQPGYGHYVFGDYYDRSFLSVGIFPWFSFSYASGPSRPLFYDPVFTFYASVNIQRDPGWVTRMRREYIVRRDNVAMRPPRTYIEQTRIIERNVNITNNVMARPVHELAGRGAAGGIRMERVSAESRQQWHERAADLREFRAERSQQERQASRWRTAGTGENRGQAAALARPRPMSLHPSPVSAPLHNHAAAGRPIGPSGHAERPELAAAHRSGSASAAQARGGSPTIRHERPSEPVVPNHALHAGQAAPHDTGDAPLPRSQRPLAEHGPAPRADAPRLHAPPQYTHRQPPPAPRPLSRQDHEKARRSP